jgi:repressor LexA
MADIEDRKTRGGGFTSWGIILRFIDDHVKEHGYPPTHKEMMKALGVNSTSTIAHHMSYLIARGLITREPFKSRTTQITDKGREVLDR